MTALLVSIVVWGIVAFMATDDYCKKHEKVALRFLVVVGVALTTLGAWRFEIDQYREVQIHDLLLLGFLPISLLYLRQKTHLVKNQSEAQGREVSLLELNLEAVTEKGAVRTFLLLRVVMWGYAVVLLIIHLWSESGNSI